MQALSVINTELVRTRFHKNLVLMQKWNMNRNTLEGARAAVSEHLRYSTGHSCVTGMSIFIFKEGL
jgi:predicted double-glycine peptidase